MLRRSAYRPIDQFHEHRADYQRDNPGFSLIPQPAADSLVRQVVAMFEAESVIVEAEAENFADGQKHGEVEKDSKWIMLACAAVGPIAQGPRPVGREQ